MSLSSWWDFRAQRGAQTAMDDACRDLVLSGHVPGRESLQASVLSGQIPPEAAELIAAAKGRAALGKRAMETGDHLTATAHVESAEALVLRANEVRMWAAKRRFAAAKAEHLERQRSLDRLNRTSVTASARQSELKRLALARAAEQKRREEEARAAWSDLMGKTNLPEAGKDGGLR